MWDIGLYFSLWYAWLKFAADKITLLSPLKNTNGGGNSLTSWETMMMKIATMMILIFLLITMTKMMMMTLFEGCLRRPKITNYSRGEATVFPGITSGGKLLFCSYFISMPFTPLVEKLL